MADLANADTMDKCQPNRDQDKTHLRVLVLEDNADDVALISLILQRNGFQVIHDVAYTEETFNQRIAACSYDVIVANYNLPQLHGTESIELLRQKGLDIPVILVTGPLGETRAVECIKEGAADYVLKQHLARLPTAVRRALQEKRLRQEWRRAQEELMRSNRDLEQFAYVASHDLQEPLRMVAIFTQLLAERYSDKLDAEGKKYMQFVIGGAMRMQTMIEGLLTFSRLGQDGLKAKPTDCNQVVDQALRNLAGAVRDSGAVVTREDLPVIPADFGLLLQLFQNLIGNAMKFHRAEAPQVKVAAEDEGAHWVFSVSDNGIGIAPEFAENIFVIFRRLHTREEYPGNGLGLAICKKVVEQHGGQIWVESEPGRGATFRFTLPKRQAVKETESDDGEHT
jgi:signal transduction histidine kinase